ncbi:hypothetical protein RJ641_012429 [Dillenia turbinata]|uniref:Uncharacterized protein n=1 Tax=Dillenia turbinata TaxID=194707 RepID=A0AAN8V3A1_9MAGN
MVLVINPVHAPLWRELRSPSKRTLKYFPFIFAQRSGESQRPICSKTRFQNRETSNSGTLSQFLQIYFDGFVLFLFCLISFRAICEFFLTSLVFSSAMEVVY